MQQDLKELNNCLPQIADDSDEDPPAEMQRTARHKKRMKERNAQISAGRPPMQDPELRAPGAEQALFRKYRQLSGRKLDAMLPGLAFNRRGSSKDESATYSGDISTADPPSGVMSAGVPGEDTPFHN